jgi:hypothetical protein
MLGFDLEGSPNDRFWDKAVITDGGAERLQSPNPAICAHARASLSNVEG